MLLPPLPPPPPPPPPLEEAGGPTAASPPSPPAAATPSVGVNDTFPDVFRSALVAQTGADATPADAAGEVGAVADDGEDGAAL